MIKTMPYSLYKKSYDEFKADNYNASKKTIDVELPDYKKPQFPKNWEKRSNRYIAANGCIVYFWNTGLAENFLVEHGCGYGKQSKSFSAGLYARENVMKFVESFG